jgi:hypothetical protein
MEIENYKYIKEYINRELIVENGVITRNLTETDLIRLIAGFKVENK